VSLTTAPAQLLVTSQAQALTGAVDGGSVTVVNMDLVQNVYVGYQPGLQPGASDAISVPPLGASVIDTSNQSYIVSAVPTGIACQLIPGAAQWTPSPAQVSAQISALGLMKDSTGQAINGTLGVPAQTGDVITTLPANIQAMGAPPYITGLRSFSEVNGSAAASPYTIHTFGANGRLWYAHLSAAVATSSAYSGGLSGVFAELSTGSGLVLGVIELSIGAAGVSDSGNGDMSIGGLPVASGDTLLLNVNNGTSITDAFIRSSAMALVSFP
jgi:hypothetical protein